MIKRVRMLTLTLDPKKVEGGPEAGYDELMRLWNIWRTYLRRHLGRSPEFIWVVEPHESGWPHLHILIDSYLPQAWVSRTWDAIGGGRVADIRSVTLENVARYLSKYLSKKLHESYIPKGKRRVGSSKGIKLALSRRANGSGLWKLEKHGRLRMFGASTAGGEHRVEAVLPARREEE